MESYKSGHKGVALKTVVLCFLLLVGGDYFGRLDGWMDGWRAYAVDRQVSKIREINHGITKNKR